MWPSATTMSVSHVCHVYARAARLILLTRAHNSQPVIGKRRAPRPRRRRRRSCRPASRATARPRKQEHLLRLCVGLASEGQARAEERAEETQSVDVPVAKAGQCTSVGRLTLARRGAVYHGRPTSPHESVLQEKAGQCTSVGRHTLALCGAVSRGGPTYPHASVCQSKAGPCTTEGRRTLALRGAV